MNPRQRDYFRSRLLAWRTELQRRQGRPLEVLTREKVRFADPVDQGVQEVDLQQDLENLHRNQLLLREIEAALTRIENGSYGYCLESGEEIGLERLMALPVATLSVEMQEQREKNKRYRRSPAAGEERRLVL
ncbi:MAG: TraR/DksA C4-type zinc finger protein [Desulfuromonadales bacterium]|jgi:DnaK suppressor protein